MIVVKVELWSAIDRSKTELARMYVSNKGGTAQKGDYDVEVLKGRSTEALDKRTVLKRGEVLGHPRLREHVWNLVAKALNNLGYGQ